MAVRYKCRGVTAQNLVHPTVYVAFQRKETKDRRPQLRKLGAAIFQVTYGDKTDPPIGSCILQTAGSAHLSANAMQ